jgi:peptide/nickel transport system permease protein
MSAPATDNPTVESAASLWQGAWRQLRRNRLAMACLGVIVFYAMVAAYAESVYWTHKRQQKTPPYKQVNFDHRFAKPSMAHPLGTDSLGRDVFLQVVQGTRVAFEVGIFTSVIAIPIAVVFGALAGYFGRRVDDIIVWLYTVFDSVPYLLFIIAIAMIVGKGLVGVCLGIGLTTWVGLCRLIRGEYIKHRDRQYVLAAKALGVGNLSIIFRHIFPNVAHLVIISFSLRFPGAVLTEVVLSYLGIGVQGEPSWGIMISDSKVRLWQGHWYELGGATIAMFFIVLAFNLFGDALRDALDPKLRTAEAKTA